MALRWLLEPRDSLYLRREETAKSFFPESEGTTRGNKCGILTSRGRPRSRLQASSFAIPYELTLPYRKGARIVAIRGHEVLTLRLWYVRHLAY